MNWKESLLDAFVSSSIISGILAVGIWGAIIALAWSNRGSPEAVIPEVLVIGGTTVIAFFFGARMGQATEKRRNNKAGTTK